MFAVSALCGHQFCMECMKRYIEVGLLEGTALGCPHHQCESKLDITSCANLLTPKLREMWERRIEEESVPVADRVYCPNPRCSALMSKADLSKSTEDGSTRCCVRCGKRFCINCKVAWHRSLSCDDYKRLGPNPTENDIKLISLANQEKWRRCGKCQHMVEHSSGCTHITCRYHHHIFELHSSSY
ncbi:unnamed protein product [Microthlaspi erraticum]|uniref:RBR-type E3 ubiquitin transferase n=1 Tax=Microthlaspi erraticum TaxID=1685480 RepID=A0A6D2K9H6_9BRAS|nr:unnamed protein product [Microthlaspi erraticum]